MVNIYFHLILSYLILSNFGCLMSRNNFTFWAGLHGMSFLLHTAWQRFNRWSNFAEEKTLFSPNKFCGSTRDSVSQCDVINWSPTFSFSQFRSCPPKEIIANHAILRLGLRLYIYWTGPVNIFIPWPLPFSILIGNYSRRGLLKRLLLNPISRIFQC